MLAKSFKLVLTTAAQLSNKEKKIYGLSMKGAEKATSVGYTTTICQLRLYVGVSRHISKNNEKLHMWRHVPATSNITQFFRVYSHQ